jgi:excisionase family DNA binding protein
VETANGDRTKLTPPELARRWGVSSDKVRAWIESGELRAINLATRPSGRPRYRIDLADVLAFEQRREANGVSKMARHHETTNKH